VNIIGFPQTRTAGEDKNFPCAEFLSNFSDAVTVKPYYFSTYINRKNSLACQEENLGQVVLPLIVKTLLEKTPRLYDLALATNSLTTSKIGRTPCNGGTV
jgi:hypothetical protein